MMSISNNCDRVACLDCRWWVFGRRRWCWAVVVGEGWTLSLELTAGAIPLVWRSFSFVFGEDFGR